MRILVTGGAGFIGSTIVDQLVDLDHDVVVIDSLLDAAHRREPDYLNPSAVYHWRDLRDLDAAMDAVAGADAVCHQASMVGLGVDFGDVTAYVAHNDLATGQLLRALHARAFSGRFVLASSMVVYGEGRYCCPTDGVVRPGPRRTVDLDAGQFEPRCPTCGSALVAQSIDEDASTDPRNVYAATKLHQEHLVAAYAREHHATAYALRYHNVYGPRMPRNTPYAGVASIFRSAAARGDAPRVFEDGAQRRDFIHVDDVARANVAALTAEGRSPFTALNVATGVPHTVHEMAVALARAFGDDAPEPVVTGAHRIGDVRHIFASPERARRELGFGAEIDFAAGMTGFALAPLRTD